MKKLYSLIILLIIHNTQAQEWKYITPLKFQSEITYFETTPDGILYMFDEHTNNISSTSDGLIWKKKYEGTNLKDMQMVNDNLGFVLKNSSLIKTSNGFHPNSISEISINATSAQALHFIDSQIGFISCTTGGVLKTLDSGNTFTAINTSSTTETLNDVFFLNENVGFVCGSKGNIYKTTNQGESWTSMNISGNVPLNKILYLDNNVGFLIGGATVYKTTNQGESWNVIFTGYSTLLDIKQYNNILYVTGKAGRLYSSSDFGLNWNEHIVVPSNFVEIRSMTIFNENILVSYEGNGGGKIYQSPNLTDWSIILEGIMESSLRDISFSNDNYGVATGIYAGSDGITNVIIQTSNGGYTWTVKRSSQTNTLYRAVEMNAAGTGLVVGGSSNAITTTSDFGETWTSSASYPQTSLSDCYLKDNGDFIIGTDPGGTVNDGLILKTASGWTQFTDITQVKVLAFANDNFGFAGGMSGLWKTLDGGLSWSQVTNVNSYSATIGFIGNKVWMLGTPSYYSVDFGETWIQEDIEVRNFHFFDDLNGYGFKNGDLMKSTDGGVTWQLMIPSSSLWESGSSNRIIYFEDKIIKIGDNSDISILELDDVLPDHCLSAPNGQNPENGVFIPTCTGISEIITSSARTGEFSLVSVLTDEQYIFSSSVSSDFITIANGEGTEILAQGISPLTWTPESDQMVRFYLHTDSYCNYDQELRERSVSCGELTIPENDHCEDAINLLCGNIIGGSTLNATNSTGNPSGDVFYIYQGTGVSQTITVSLCSADFDTVLSVFSDCSFTNEIAYNDNACGLQSELSFISDGTSDYYIMVEGKEIEAGEFDIQISCETILASNEYNLNDFSFYPNPVENSINIVSEKNITEIKIFDLKGKSYDNYVIQTGNTIATSQLPNGIYLFRVVLSGGQIETFKVVKK